MSEGSGHKDGSEPRLLIGHISADFPDSIQPRKTPVIQRLLDLAPAPFAHITMSLNRISPGPQALAKAIARGAGGPAIVVESRAEQFGEAICYQAPGKGLFHLSCLRQLGEWLAVRFAGERTPDLLIGHKLCVEGIAAGHAAALLGRPYAITIQGNTDLKILRSRPDLRKVIGEVFHGAAHVFSFAPWSLAEVQRLLGPRAGPCDILPCPPDFDDLISPDLGGSGLLSVFHLHNSKGKNLARMAAAMDRLAQRLPDCHLTIAGGGSERDIARCRAIIAGRANMQLPGAMSRTALRQSMNGAAGFVLPSLRESFGLVFIEALLSGLPIIYPKGAAVDGYFDGCRFAIAVDARSTSAIAEAMIALVRDSIERKQELRAWQQSAAAQRFLPGAIGETFRAGLRSAARPHQ